MTSRIKVYGSFPNDSYSVEVGKDENGIPIRRRTGYKDGLKALLPNGAKTLYELFVFSVEKYSDRKFFGKRDVLEVFEEKIVVDGVEKVFTFPKLSPFKWLTYNQVLEKVKNFGSGLNKIGLKKKGILGFFLETSIYWSIASRACYFNRVTILTIYANLGEDAFVHALNEGEITHLLTDSSLLPTIMNVKKDLPTLTTLIYTGDVSKEDIELFKKSGVEIYSFDKILELGENYPSKIIEPKPDDIACIMYTSGSTGVPKGVMITHKNVIASVTGMLCHLEYSNDEYYLNYLPLAHIFSFVIENVVIYLGGHIGFGTIRTLSNGGVRDCLGDIQELCPTIFISVPAIYERIKHGITSRINNSNFLLRFLFNKAYNARVSALRSGSDTPIWNKIIFSKISSFLGGRVNLMASGSASLSPEVHDFIRVCFGIPLMQGYGLTETTSSGSAMLRTMSMDCGTIGAIFPNNEYKLVDIPDMGYTSKSKPYPCGEIWIRGDSVAKGYFKQQEKTKESFIDGWFATGDVAALLPDGQFAIIDRKKNLIKPPHGEYISIDKLESAYRTSSLVENILVYADSNHFHCVAIVSPNYDVFVDELNKVNNKYSKTDIRSKICDKFAKNFMLHNLQEVGKKCRLKSIEIIRAVHLTYDQWTPQNNLLTGAMKINRNYIIDQMKPEIDRMYQTLKD